MRSRRWLVLACCFVLSIVGCTTSKSIGLRGELERLDARIHSPKGQPVAGYTDTRGAYHDFAGYARFLPGDSIEFHAPAVSGARTRGAGIRRDIPVRSVLLPRDSVSTIYVTRTSASRTILAVIGSVVLVSAVVIGIALATKESCPFIYSWDGEQYVFDGEPYGGATMRSLERTDWSELEHLTASRGEYRLLLTNEVDETQHTNRIALRVIDHPAGTTMVMDREGRAHAFRALEPLTVARDEAGKDLLAWLRHNDRVAWYPDLRAYAREDSIADTRNHITLEFARPPGIARAFLVTNAATGQWGSHMIRTMLGMRGTSVQDFYAAINGSPFYRQQLYEWNHREELFELFVEVRQADQWVRGDFIPGGGPLISESRAIPVDLAGVTGDRIQIRVHPPIGFWNLNSFQLAWDESAASETELLPESASGVGGAAAVNTLASVDDLYLDFPGRGDHTELVFKAPPARPGMERTVFAETRGWYEVHLHDLQPPDVAAIERLTSEPGFVVRRALHEFADYQRTGVLLGVPTEPAVAGGR